MVMKKCLPLLLLGALAWSPLAAQDQDAEKEGSARFASSQSLIKGLLLAEIGTETYVGKSSQMNATAVPKNHSRESTLEFNQEVGEDMAKALKEAQKFLTVRHKGWPSGHEVEISFEEKYGPKDGPSAALACALMLESLFTGQGLDKATAVTGDLNADGSVQSVGGVADKVRGAAKGGCTVVIVPKVCGAQVSDAALLDGVSVLFSTQIFCVDTFDEAWSVAVGKRDPKMAEAIAAFDTIQAALRRQAQPASVLRHPKMIERLQQVLAAAPMHGSARLLLLHATGQAPKTLSAGGSWAQLAKSGDLLMRAARDRSTDNLAPDAVGNVVSHIHKLRASLDPRLRRYADSLADLGTEIRQVKNQPKRTAAEQMKARDRIRTRADNADSEFEKLRANQELMEELLR